MQVLDTSGINYIEIYKKLHASRRLNDKMQDFVEMCIRDRYEREHNGETAHADVIVVDPPRKGCDETLLETIVKMQDVYKRQALERISRQT